jgi:4-hydroxyphenylpyruvate dioxygenase
MATYQPSILSASLGRAWHHDLHHKLRQAAADGFKGVEIFYEDLEYDAKRKFQTESPSPEQLIEAAAGIHETCQSAGLEIIDLQPFLFYDGLLDRAEHDRLIEKIHVWFRIVKKLRTNTIQIPANFLFVSLFSCNGSPTFMFWNVLECNTLGSVAGLTSPLGLLKNSPATSM